MVKKNDDSGSNQNINQRIETWLTALTSSHNMELVPAVEKQFEYYESRVAEYQKHRDNKLRFKGA